jgi:hypothetical protein
MDVASCINYYLENFQYKISCCVGSRRRQIDFFGRIKNNPVHAPTSGFLLFLPRIEYKIFHIENLHDCSVNIWLYLGILSNFIESLKFVFFKVSKEGSNLCAKMAHSDLEEKESLFTMYGHAFTVLDLRLCLQGSINSSR